MKILRLLLREESKKDLGPQNSTDVLQSLDTFRHFDHPYDGQFVPKVYLQNDKTTYVVIAESNKLSCTDLNDPNHAFLHISAEEVVGVVFEKEPVEESSPTAEEALPPPTWLQKLPYWTIPAIVLFNCAVFILAAVYSWHLWAMDSSPPPDYRPITDATEQVILQRRANGIFVVGTLKGDELIVLSRKRIADFYVFKYSNDHEGVVPFKVESRPFSYVKIGDAFALRFEGSSPIYVPTPESIQFNNQVFNRYEGDFGDFF